MVNEILKKESSIPDVMLELQDMENVVKALMASKHYSKLGSDGIYAIVNKAKAMGIDVLEALNGGLYFVKGKTEMSSQMMNRLIRSKGHSITKDAKSNNTCCILHGKRSDNGDTWTVSFSIDDAKRAGIATSGGVWDKYPSVMCFNRALSMLARQLFPDLIVDCYVEGEIRDAPALDTPVIQYITEEEAEALATDLAKFPAYSVEVRDFLQARYQISNLSMLTREIYDRIQKKLAKLQEETAKAEEKEEDKIQEIIDELPIESMVAAAMNQPDYPKTHLIDQPETFNF